MDNNCKTSETGKSAPTCSKRHYHYDNSLRYIIRRERFFKGEPFTEDFPRATDEFAGTYSWRNEIGNVTISCPEKPNSLSTASESRQGRNIEFKAISYVLENSGLYLSRIIRPHFEGSESNGVKLHVNLPIAASTMSQMIHLFYNGFVVLKYEEMASFWQAADYLEIHQENSAYSYRYHVETQENGQIPVDESNYDLFPTETDAPRLLTEATTAAPSTNSVFHSESDLAALQGEYYPSNENNPEKRWLLYYQPDSEESDSVATVEEEEKPNIWPPDVDTASDIPSGCPITQPVAAALQSESSSASNSFENDIVFCSSCLLSIETDKFASHFPLCRQRTLIDCGVRGASLTTDGHIHFSDMPKNSDGNKSSGEKNAVFNSKRKRESEQDDGSSYQETCKKRW